LTEGGRVEPPELAALTVEPGLTRVVDLTETSGGRPVTAVVETDEGTLVVAQASITSTGYAIAIGVRLDQV
jgi:urease beta subunit